MSEVQHRQSTRKQNKKVRRKTEKWGVSSLELDDVSLFQNIFTERLLALKVKFRTSVNCDNEKTFSRQKLTISLSDPLGSTHTHTHKSNFKIGEHDLAEHRSFNHRTCGTQNFWLAPTRTKCHEVRRTSVSLFGEAGPPPTRFQDLQKRRI